MQNIDEESFGIEADETDVLNESQTPSTEVLLALRKAASTLRRLSNNPDSPDLAYLIQIQVLPMLSASLASLPSDEPEFARSVRRLQGTIQVLEAVIEKTEKERKASKPAMTSQHSQVNDLPVMDYNEAKSDEQLDSFADARRAAIEATIISNSKELPPLSDIVGLEKAKEALFEALVDPIRYSEWFANSDLRPWKCVLLYGPPGTGKSHLSRAIAREIGCRFYQVSSSDLISSWSGQSERLVRALFDHALAHNDASIIFIDETELLVQLQRLHSSETRVLLICATNCPWELDPAFLRRFEKRIYVGLPDHDARRDLFEMLLKRTAREPNVTGDWLAGKTNGHSGDDIRRLSRELAFRLFRRFKKGSSKGGDALSQADVDDVLKGFAPSVSPEHLKKFEQYIS